MLGDRPLATQPKICGGAIGCAAKSNAEDGTRLLSFTSDSKPKLFPQRSRICGVQFLELEKLCCSGAVASAENPPSCDHLLPGHFSLSVGNLALG